MKSSTHPSTSIGREELLNEFLRVAKGIGRFPTQKEMNQFGCYSADYYARFFGSWREAVFSAVEAQTQGRASVPVYRADGSNHETTQEQDLSEVADALPTIDTLIEKMGL